MRELELILQAVKLHSFFVIFLQRVELYFPDRVAFEEFCWADYLEIYDGSDVSSPRFGRYFDKDHPPIMISTREVLTLHFVSDNWENRAGFNVTWKFSK